MMRRLDNLWYGLLHRVHRWILSRVAAHCERDMGRATRAKCRRDAVRRLRQELAWQKPHLN
jgi:hypothetical protein